MSGLKTKIFTMEWTEGSGVFWQAKLTGSADPKEIIISRVSDGAVFDTYPITGSTEWIDFSDPNILQLIEDLAPKRYEDLIKAIIRRDFLVENDPDNNSPE